MTLEEGTKAKGWKLVEETSTSTRVFPDNRVVQQNRLSWKGVGSKVIAPVQRKS